MEEGGGGVERVSVCLCVCVALGVFHRIANTSPRSESPIGTETSVEREDASLLGLSLEKEEERGREEEKEGGRGGSRGGRELWPAN